MQIQEAQTRTRRLATDAAIASTLGKTVTYKAIRKMIKSRSYQKTIGEDRADKVWGWAARTCGIPGSDHKLVAPKGQNQQWIDENLRAVLEAREEQAWNPSAKNLARARREEVTGRVRAWILEYENPAQQGKPQLLRPAKFLKLKADSNNMAKARGGPMALMSALLILSDQGEILLTQPPMRPRRGGSWITWILEAKQWMTENDWMTIPEAEQAAAMATKNHQKAQLMETDMTIRVMDIGMGGGSVGPALRDTDEDIRVIGVDGRGMTHTGKAHDSTAAEVKHDLTTDTSLTDTITAISRKAGIYHKSWKLIWISLTSLECSLPNKSNASNQAKRGVQGKQAPAPNLNRSMATSNLIQRLQQAERVTEANVAVSNLMDALETHPDLLFALENPRDSALWIVPQLMKALGRNQDWGLVCVDQCAYGREAQEPTTIMTNIPWTPQGWTSTGRCVMGRCAGTLNNPEGIQTHTRQTMDSTKERRTTAGGKQKAGKNITRDEAEREVAPALVQEIMTAALLAHKHKKKRATRKRKRDAIASATMV